MPPDEVFQARVERLLKEPCPECGGLHIAVSGNGPFYSFRCLDCQIILMAKGERLEWMLPRWRKGIAEEKKH